MAANRIRRLLGHSALLEVRAMYEERHENGARRHSQAYIAKVMGVSETTIFRAVRNFGAYVKETDNLVLPASPAQQAAAQASLERLQKLLATDAVKAAAPRDEIDWDTLTIKKPADQG